MEDSIKEKLFEVLILADYPNRYKYPEISKITDSIFDNHKEFEDFLKYVAKKKNNTEIVWRAKELINSLKLLSED